MRAMKLTKKIILDEIKTRPDYYDNKKLARALGVKGDDRRELRQLLRTLVEDGALIKSTRKTFREADALPSVMVVRATRLDSDGDLMGEPENWKGDGVPPQLLILSTLPRGKKGAKRNQTEILKVGDRALCRIKTRDNGETVASVMKKLGSGPTAHLGVLYKGGRGWRIQPVSKKARHDYKPVRVPDEAEDQDLVWFKSSRRNQGDMRLAEITEIIGSAKGGKSASLISLHENDIRVAFPDKVTEEAKSLKVPKKAVGSFGSPLLMWRALSRRDQNWIWKPANAGTRFISPMWSCRCCRMNSPQTSARSVRMKTAPVWPCAWSLIRRA